MAKAAAPDARALVRSRAVLRMMTGVGSSTMHELRDGLAGRRLSQSPVDEDHVRVRRFGPVHEAFAVVDHVDHVDAALGEKQGEGVTEVGAVGGKQNAHTPPPG